MQKVIDQLLSTSPSTIVELFKLDLLPIGIDTQYYFHAGTNSLNQNVFWQGIEYSAFPIEVKGYEVSSSGSPARPTLTISNIGNIIGSLASLHNGLLGASLLRKRTFLKYLDAINFESGNTEEDPNVELSQELYYINRKASENHLFIEYELTSKWDVYGVKLPRRIVAQDTCSWVYRSTECGYTGTNYFNIANQSVANQEDDVCSHNLKGCEVRFGVNNILPFGGFPGAGLRRR